MMSKMLMLLGDRIGTTVGIGSIGAATIPRATTS